MPKIVQIVPALGWGGAQIFCIQLCNELVARPGFEVILVSLYNHTSSHLPLEKLNSKVRFIELGKRRGIDWKIFARLDRLLTELVPDVVHTHLHAGYYVGWAYLRDRSSFRKIHTFHNLVKKDAPWHGRLVYKYFFRKQIVTPVSISEEVLRGAIKEYGNQFNVLIHNGTVPVKKTELFDEVREKYQALKKNGKTKVLINVARVMKQKNQKLILESFRLLEKENVIAVIVGGSTPEEVDLYDELRQQKPDNVHFVGKVSNVGDHILNSDGFLLSSIYEGLPISLLEAMSVGLIPICTPVGGIKDVVKGTFGFLTEDLSVNSMVSEILKFLHLDETNIAKMKNVAKEEFEINFDMKSCCDKYVALYFNEKR